MHGMYQLCHFVLIKSLKEVSWLSVENVIIQMLLGTANGSSVQAAVKYMKDKVLR